MLDKVKVDFAEFGSAVRARYDRLRQGELYTTNVDPDEFWDYYQKSFPEGTNNIFRERAEHDCSCCKNFIRNLGSVVGIVDGVVRNIWDIPEVGWPYDPVAKAMAEYMSSRTITGIYRTSEGKYGAEVTPELRDGEILKWTHFSGSVDKDHKMSGDKLGPFKSKIESTYQVLSRGLDEITDEATDDVLALIADNAIYRGDEFKESVQSFRKLQKQYKESGNHKEVFLWQSLDNPSARFRNTAIGTLLVDLSEGVELVKAVKKFEAKVAPENYKRPTSLITPRMVNNALETLDELGLRDSIERRHAVIDDISVNDVLFVDNSVAPLMKDNLSDLLMEETSTASVNIDNAKEISIDQFINDVVPDSSSLEALFDSEHISNLMTLTAPTKPDSKQLFKWGNGFAWSYNGDMADSALKQRVKNAGGNVDAALRVSLGWYNYDDLDIHVYDPHDRHIYFGQKLGILDVDMNAGHTQSREPVENMQWRNMPTDGVYRVFVHNYTKRESVDNGFELEFAFGNDVRQYRYDKPVGSNQRIDCLLIELLNGSIKRIEHYNSLTEGRSSQDMWGLTTQQLIPIDSITLSPNHWGGEHGNKHWFFFLKDCKNPDPVRGIYNEYLSNEVNDHRKVFEVLAGKTKAPYQDSQLSGLGFSSTQRQSVTIVAKGKTNRAYKVQF